MRLTSDKQLALFAWLLPKPLAREQLFGTRVDDAKRGDVIDLRVSPRHDAAGCLFDREIRMLTMWERLLGECNSMW